MTLPDWILEIEKRTAKATPGPWEAPYMERDKTWPGLYSLESYEKFPLEYGLDGEEGIYADNNHDFEFIAHSRTDVPRLIDALKIALEALETLADDPDELTLKCIQGQSPTAIRFIQAGCLISREALAKIRGDEK